MLLVEDKNRLRVFNPNELAPAQTLERVFEIRRQVPLLRSEAIDRAAGSRMKRMPLS
jgi:hypothetical protein